VARAANKGWERVGLAWLALALFVVWGCGGGWQAGVVAIGATIPDYSAVALGVDIDTRGAARLVRAFSNAARITYPVWLDPDDRVSARFSVAALPTTYLIDRDGVLRWVRVGALRRGDRELTQALSQLLPRLLPKSSGSNQDEVAVAGNDDAVEAWRVRSTAQGRRRLRTSTRRSELEPAKLGGFAV
jgi:hypothetical protein